MMTNTLANESAAPVIANAAASSSERKAKPTPANPYKKEKPNKPVTVDAKLAKRRQFAEKYRVQAQSHGRRLRGGPVACASALDLINRTRQWRDSWSRDSATGHAPIKNPLRPRLFLFRRPEHVEQPRPSLLHPQQPFDKETNGPTQHRRQEEGIWELDTGITELAGCAGSGKTQASLSLCATCVLTPLRYPCLDNLDPASTLSRANVHEIHNNHYRSIYISMGEGMRAVSIALRLEKMLRARLKKVDSNEMTEILTRIGLLTLRNEEDFVEFVEKDLPRLLAGQNQNTRQHDAHRPRPSKIGLIVFDGIAGFFRFSDPVFPHSRNSMFHKQRSSKLLQVSSNLRKLSDVYDVPILITNQVTACIPPTEGSGSANASLSQEQVVPALGLAWSNCVSTRILLRRENGLRKARVLQSVNMPEPREVTYCIRTEQVAAVSKFN